MYEVEDRRTSPFTCGFEYGISKKNWPFAIVRTLPRQTVALLYSKDMANLIATFLTKEAAHGQPRIPSQDLPER